eukprot:CAMPEP_0202711498 /NCGR_PEP_ID=MMETSP1385-20130828/23297_1 /ASSEMBLY_ACC=CAM_ASM_000861 /TAXON_ID=933848 /ORGANISM="Elphidium margaritaceum" /LENGTH=1249 /DNA_ID=CAMNT_0049371245 /DNA_START=57 /DNA_END=3806 /DNA_ORIENTATION=+
MAEKKKNPNLLAAGSSHAYSRSQPHLFLPMMNMNAMAPGPAVKYRANPISHFSTQYSAHTPQYPALPSPSNIARSQSSKQHQPAPNPNAAAPEFLRSKPKHIQQHSVPVDDGGGGADKSHARNASLSYIQQRQSQFFLANLSEPSDSDDDDIYDDMYKDGMGANSQVIQSKLSAQQRKKAKKRKGKGKGARAETHNDMWCCGVCTYQNNLLLAYCELCGAKKPEKPHLVKQPIYAPLNGRKKAFAKQTHSQTHNNLPAPSPSPQSPDTDNSGLGLNLLDLEEDDGDNQQAQHQEIPDLLSVPANTVMSPRRHIRHTQSESNVLMAKQNVLKYWQCAVCTFASNPIEYPVCKVCSALPPQAPPSPPPPADAAAGNKQQATGKLYAQQQQALDALSVSHLNGAAALEPVVAAAAAAVDGFPIANGAVNKRLSKKRNSNIKFTAKKEKVETGPLGHHKKASITELPMLDQSKSSKKKTAAPAGAAGAENAVVDFNFSDDQAQQQSSSSPAKGKVFYGDIPDLPMDGDADDKPSGPAPAVPAAADGTIASLGSDIQAQNEANKSVGGGIGSFLGNLYRRARAQSTDISAPNSAFSAEHQRARARSKSPFAGGGGGKNGSNASQPNEKRNISVATMPKKQQERIAKRLNGLHDKKSLLKELDNSVAKLQKKLKQHADQVMQLKSQINVTEQHRAQELKQWGAWYILELVELAKEYYDHRLSYLNHMIELEKLHIECFSEKLQRLEIASKRIKKNKKWTVDDVRNNIEVAFHTAWRIRLSQDVPDKQDYAKQLSKIVESLKLGYEAKKTTLGKEEVSIEERKEQVFLFLQSTLAKYESRQMAENKEFKLSRNLENEDDFFAPYDETDQNLFDSFVLDQRTKEGRILSHWLVFIRKKSVDITFEDLSDFMQKLSHTFLHSYSLSNKQYYECVRILCYRCVLRQRVIKRIVFDLIDTAPSLDPAEVAAAANGGGSGGAAADNNAAASASSSTENPELIAMRQIANLDVVYGKKVMWMRALNAQQLGIKSDYWLKQEEHVFGDALTAAAPRSQNGRRSSQIAMLAGKDIPFAEAINLMGQLEVDFAVVEAYKEQIESKNRSNAPAAKKSMFHRGNKLLSIEEEKKQQNASDDAKRNKNLIPFILPQTGLQTLLAATKCVYSTAMEYYYRQYPEKKGDKDDDGAYISQDDLFPIILYCVMQSKLETPHRFIHFVEHILPKEKTTMGQSAFALSALKAAVEYISHAKPATFGMDSEIELD